MHEPNDSRPQQAANRLRALVFIPAFIGVVGILFLAVRLSDRFNALEEPPVRDYPVGPQPKPGTSGQPLRAVIARPKGRPADIALTNGNAPSLPATSAPASAVSVSPVESKPLVATDAAPSVVPLIVGGVASAVSRFQTNGIVGRVVLRGTPPPEKEIPMDPSCGRLHEGKSRPTTRLYVVGTNGALADVFVVLKDFPTGRFEGVANAVEIHQRGCEYLPYISAAQVGQTIRVFNGDPLMHNVHPTPSVDGNPEQNRVQLNAAAPPLDHVFNQPELFLRFKCDVHPWMFAYVNVVEHPFFAVSGADGQFALPEPPPGNYTLQFIHRKGAGKLVPVRKQAGKRLVVNVTLDLLDRDQSEATVTEDQAAPALR